MRYSKISPKICTVPHLCSSVDFEHKFRGSDTAVNGLAECFDSKTTVTVSKGESEPSLFQIYLCDEDKAVLLVCQEEILRRLLPLQRLGQQENLSAATESRKNQDSNSMSIIDEVVRQVICEDQVDVRVDLVESRLEDEDQVSSTNVGIFTMKHFRFHTHFSRGLKNNLPVQNESTTIHMDLLKFESLLESSSFYIATRFCFQEIAGKEIRKGQ